MLTISPVINPGKVWVLCSTRLSVATQYGDENKKTTCNCIPKLNLIFRATCLTALLVVQEVQIIVSKSQQEITKTQYLKI